ncbi:Metacaspase-6 [Dendrobium catenatum]|uniref:Metacaspase-6 n=1 Tax=Dendrobium catenatum TaxID=906689 RepID=A0A2I0XGT3_9ASPA|nr:Metacaspase-6 [Dendrobium catenatum]
MVGKAAVLIGCNYPGTKAELKGCVNDVHRMRRCLIDHFGFTEANITILIDTDDSYTLPTGVNIRRAINRLVRSANPGDDDLFLHFSGHGARLPAQPEENDNTGYHECIVPCDMNLIIDEDFRHFVNKLADGCRLTIVADSCNSGGLIENAKEQIGESTAKRKDEGNESREDIHLTGRALPIPILVELLKESTGKEDIHEGNIRSTIIDAFGDSASPRLAKTAPSGRSVLISACQSDQNAADAKPVMKPEEHMVLSATQFRAY